MVYQVNPTGSLAFITKERSMLFCLTVGVILYLLGYHWDSVSTGPVLIPYFRKTIKPPRFIFLICASPKSKKYPIGVMVSGAVANQLLGIGFAIYALILFFTYPSVPIQIVCLFVILAIVYFITHWLSEKYPYIE
jgi:hypothetical protein